MNPELVLITGMSGSGKSVALHALEDAGYYCVDNLPPELLLPFVQLEQQHRATKIAIAMDVRSANSLPLVPAQLAHLRTLDVNIRLLFLDATTEILVHRFSETRRRHPLSRQEDQSMVPDQQRDLIEAIELERQLRRHQRQRISASNIHCNRDFGGAVLLLELHKGQQQFGWQVVYAVITGVFQRVQSHRFAEA